MDEFLEALTDADFMFFIDDLDHQFQLELIEAQYKNPRYTKEQEDARNRK